MSKAASRSCQLLMVACLLLFLSLTAFAANPIQLENAKTGTTAWQITNPATTAGQIEGYASLASVARGGQISFFVNTTDPSYTLQVFRTGWYNGTGARQMTSAVTLPGIKQPIPSLDPTTGLAECNWSNPYVLNIPNDTSDPTDWASGVYLALLTGTSSGLQSYIVFTVRDDSRSSNYLFLNSTNTYHAYNGWGGKSLYSYNSSNSVPAVKVSYNRPYDANYGTGKYLLLEYEMVRFLEREGYDVTYATDIDLHENSNLPLNHNGVLVVGHGEYYSWAMRANMLAARDAGVNIAIFAANTCYWQVRFEPSVVNGAADRTLVGYKEVALTEDPYYLGGNTALYPYVTTNWRDAPVNLPEDEWEGVIYEWGSGLSGDIIVSDASSWVWASTGVANGTHLTGLLGDEVDDLGPEAPSNTLAVALSPWSSPGNGSGTSAIAWYTAPSGATVFSVGTIHWVWGVDSWRMPGSGDPSTVNAAAQQATRNVLARFVSNAAPTNTALPVIAGPNTEQGTVLTTSNGSWTGSPTSYSYQWARCDMSGANCVVIATTQTYTLAPADVGSTIRVTVTATNTAGSTPATSLPTALVVSATPTITTQTLPAGNLNTPYSATLAVSGGTSPYSWTLINGTTLPPGLQLNSGTGAITGSPTATGTTNFTVQVTDHNSKTATQALSIAVSAVAAPARVQAASVEGSSVASVSVAFPASNTAGDLIVAFVRASTTPSITLSDTAGNTYTQAVTQAQTTDGHQIAIFYAPNIKSSGGINTVTATFSASNNHPFLAIYEYSGVSTLDKTAAAQGTTAAASSGATATTTAANELVFGGLGLPSSSTTTVTAGASFTLEQQDTRSGGSRAASEDQLVTTTGAYAGSFTLSAADNWSAVVATFLPESAPSTPTITTTSFAAGTQNATYSASLAATGGVSPYSWTTVNGTNLPAGLQLNASTGAITGTPTGNGATNFTVQVSDKNSATGTKALSINVNLPPTIATTTLANGTPNVAYSATLTANNGTPPYSWTLINASTLPAGLQLNSSTGAISGTPTAGGTVNFTAQVSDTNGATNSANLSIVIDPLPLSITTTTLGSGVIGVPYNATLQATGGTTQCGVFETCAGGSTPYFWALINGTTLPPGLQLNSSTGAITGTPTATGTTTFTIQVTDSGLPTPQTTHTTLSITINSSAPARVQAASVEGSAVSSVSVAFPASNTAGNLIIAFVRASTTTQTITLSDTAGNTYSQAVTQAQTTDGHQIAIFYAANIKSGANTVTATFSASNNHPFLAIYEYSGLSTTNPLDKTAAGQGTTAAASSGATATTTAANELVFAGLGLPSISTTTVTAGSGFALEQQDTRSGGSRAATEDQTVSATGAYTGNFTLSAADNWSAVVATFLPAGPPPALTVTTTSLPAGALNGAYSATLAASGGTSPYSWNLINGTTLPPGLQLNSSTGAITGSPTAIGTTNFTVQVTDHNSTTATKALSITVNAVTAPARVQAASIEGSAVASVSVAFPASNTAGDLIIAFVRASTTPSITLSDTAGNTYTQAVTQAQTTDGHQIAIFYATNIKSGGNTVTATFSGTNNHPFLAIYEYSGVSTLDKTAAAQGTTAAASSGATATTTAANELVFAGLGLPSSATQTVTAGSGFTLEQQDNGTSRAASEDQTVLATGAYSGTFTLSASTNWSCAVATFK